MAHGGGRVYPRAGQRKGAQLQIRALPVRSGGAAAGWGFGECLTPECALTPWHPSGSHPIHSTKAVPGIYRLGFLPTSSFVMIGHSCSELLEEIDHLMDGSVKRSKVDVYQ